MAFIYSALIMGGAALAYSLFVDAPLLSIIGLGILELVLAGVLYLSKRFRIYEK